ncbi:MAG: methyltransferase [Candidatus Riflebacteria bacterium]|jgi:tRNA1Val (adenine37-N6)-methyltransferase|nr:methyltransferase [Candidatus Riflebacteria bacterium]MDD3377211.1 methyltransferase [Candidatus Riflebacteria bacterium]
MAFDKNNIPIDTDERIDTIPGTDFSLIQKIDGTAFSIDTLLLADFIDFPVNLLNIADLGSGSGILAFLMKYRNEKSAVTGFEIQKEFYELACRNIQMNPQFSSVYFENTDVRDIPSRVLPESFDLVVSNPPYFPANSGRIPEKPGRAIARHELNGKLKDFVEAAAYMLPYGGRFCVVIPSIRFYEIDKYLKAADFGIKRLRFVIPKEGEKSHLVLIEADKFYSGKHESMPDITIHHADGSYGEELKEIFSVGLKRVKRFSNV